jgi:TRAP-type C4-dicarboxylate transport system substrate-binding protein
LFNQWEFPMSMRRLLKSSSAVVVCLAALSCGAQAQEIEELSFAVIAAPSNVNAWKQVQKPFYEQVLPEASGGKITVEATPHNEAGIDMVEATRMATQGVVNVVNGAFNQIAADDPRFAGIDLPGIGVTVEEARAAVEAYRDVVAKRLEEVENLKLLATGPNTMQVILCRGEITDLDYFKGKKVRVWAKAMSDYMEELGIRHGDDSVGGSASGVAERRRGLRHHQSVQRQQCALVGGAGQPDGHSARRLGHQLHRGQPRLVERAAR